MADCGIGEGLQAIANSIELLAKSQCCDTGDIIVNVNGGVNGSLSDGTITYGTEPYSEAPTSTPDGYEDNAQYEAQKCAMAHQMVSDCVYLFSVLSGAAGVSAIGGLVVTVLGVMAIITVPQVAIPTFIAVVATAFLASGSLYAASVEIEANRQDIVCALVSGDNLSDIMEALAGIFDIIVANIGASSPVGIAIKSMLLVVFSSDTLNKLYAGYAGFMYPAANCDDCNESPCGMEGEWMHFPIFSSSTDGSFSVDGDEITINATVAFDETMKYRYSAWLGDTWTVTPYNARKVVSVNCSSNLDGTSGSGGNGYFNLLGVNGNQSELPSGLGGELGYDNLVELNEFFASNDYCLSVVAIGDADSASWVTVEFQ